ncbi:hypothetical protein ACA910_000688 [Epithemia clementina (nom. ined.)]
MGINISALPEVFDTISGDFDPTELATSMMATALVRCANAAYDTGWRKDSKVRMLKIKDEQELQKFISKVEKSREPVFRQFHNRIRSIMHECGYWSREIKEYLYKRGFPGIVALSYELYLRLLHTARQKSIEFGWDGGIAMALLKTHGEGLVAVHNFSGLFRGLVFDTYMYLQDKGCRDFLTPKVQEGIYTLHVDIFARIRGGGGATRRRGVRKGNQTQSRAEAGKAANHDNLQCSHCHGRKNVHSGGKSNCPFKDLALEKAQAAAKEVREEVELSKDKNKEADLNVLITNAAAKNK